VAIQDNRLVRCLWGLTFANSSARAVQFTEQTCQHALRWSWNWETGFFRDQTDDLKYVRNYMLRMGYGNWDFKRNRARAKTESATSVEE